MIDIEYFVMIKYFIQSTVVGCISFCILMWLYFYVLALKSSKKNGLNREDFYFFWTKPKNIGLFLLAIVVVLIGALFSFFFFAAALDPLFYFWQLPLDMVDSPLLNQFRTSFTLFPLLCAWLVCIIQAIISLLLLIIVFRYAKKHYITREEHQPIFFVTMNHIRQAWLFLIILLGLYLLFFFTREEVMLNAITKVIPLFH